MTSTEQREQLREQWRERVATFRASGQSVSAWCAAQGIKAHQLRYWLSRLAPAKPAESVPSRWLPVAVHAERGQEQPASGTSLAVRVGPAVVEVQPGFDARLLAAVVRTLMELC
ncbi:MAG: helix-turn-helix domain-containing protein [Firmicutes bacterium]|nr:helix-turn-helix domain-containing protein [Bacillota bacterium]